MSKIALIGSGGVIFAMNFIKDILISEELRECEISLMDIDPDNSNCCTTQQQNTNITDGPSELDRVW